MAHINVFKCNKHRGSKLEVCSGAGLMGNLPHLEGSPGPIPQGLVFGALYFSFV